MIDRDNLDTVTWFWKVMDIAKRDPKSEEAKLVWSTAENSGAVGDGDQLSLDAAIEHLEQLAAEMGEEAATEEMDFIDDFHRHESNLEKAVCYSCGRQVPKSALEDYEGEILSDGSHPKVCIGCRHYLAQQELKAGGREMTSPKPLPDKEAVWPPKLSDQIEKVIDEMFDDDDDEEDDDEEYYEGDEISIERGDRVYAGPYGKLWVTTSPEGHLWVSSRHSDIESGYGRSLQFYEVETIQKRGRGPWIAVETNNSKDNLFVVAS